MEGRQRRSVKVAELDIGNSDDEVEKQPSGEGSSSPKLKDCGHYRSNMMMDISDDSDSPRASEPGWVEKEYVIQWVEVRDEAKLTHAHRFPLPSCFQPGYANACRLKEDVIVKWLSRGVERTVNSVVIASQDDRYEYGWHLAKLQDCLKVSPFLPGVIVLVCTKGRTHNPSVASHLADMSQRVKNLSPTPAGDKSPGGKLWSSARTRLRCALLLRPSAKSPLDLKSPRSPRCQKSPRQISEHKVQSPSERKILCLRTSAVPEPIEENSSRSQVQPSQKATSSLTKGIQSPKTGSPPPSPVLDVPVVVQCRASERWSDFQGAAGKVGMSRAFDKESWTPESDEGRRRFLEDIHYRNVSRATFVATTNVSRVTTATSRTCLEKGPICYCLPPGHFLNVANDMEDIEAIQPEA